MTPSELSRYVKAEAKRLGFAVCGIAKAEAVEGECSKEMLKWVTEGCHGTMSYLERNSEKRFNPTLLVPGCRSIICVALNYCPQQPMDENKMHIARYALGKDYHKEVKDRLYLLLQSINRVQETKGRPFCDSAPVLERYWAVKAGIGWIGKNHQLIVPKAGSYFFIGELMVDTEMEYDKPFEKNYCGNCHLCIDNCPTGALCEENFDARKCLSFLTIEHRGELPKNIGEKMGNCFYGCDRCTSCCPHNRFATPTDIPQFLPNEELLTMSKEDWRSLTPEHYERLFTGSAVERCGYEQLKRNIEALFNSR